MAAAVQASTSPTRQSSTLPAFCAAAASPTRSRASRAPSLRASPMLRLHILERAAIGWLDDPPAGELAELRGVLIGEHVQRKRLGLS
jgi:hypothetical protein